VTGFGVTSGTLQGAGTGMS